jgi:hypothetical protein
MWWAGAGLDLSYVSESPLPALEINDGPEKFLGPEIGPEDRGKIQFAVGDLIQKEIGYPQFT